MISYRKAIWGKLEWEPTQRLQILVELILPTNPFRMVRFKAISWSTIILIFWLLTFFITLYLTRYDEIEKSSLPNFFLDTYDWMTPLNCVFQLGMYFMKMNSFTNFARFLSCVRIFTFDFELFTFLKVHCEENTSMFAIYLSLICFIVSALLLCCSPLCYERLGKFC